MLSPQQRLELRVRALAQWEAAHRLSIEADRGMKTSSETMAVLARTRLESRFLRETAARRVKKVIEGAVALDRTLTVDGAVALVAAERIDRVGWLHETLHERAPRVYAAGDGPTAVGLAIVEQPDVAVIDGDLPVVGSLHTARVIRAYAPATKVLLITGELEVDQEAHAEGIATRRPSVSSAALLTTVDALLAAAS